MVTVTKYVWDPVFDCVSHELDENNAVKAVYQNEPQQYGGVLSQRRGTTSHYHHHDALGSTRFLTDSSGNVTDTYLNDAWGNSVASIGSIVNPFRWVGKYGYYQDSSTGSVYVRARMYQPTVGRWRSMDPLKFVEGMNPYRYCRNATIHQIDPSGLKVLVFAWEGAGAAGGDLISLSVMKDVYGPIATDVLGDKVEIDIRYEKEIVKYFGTPLLLNQLAQNAAQKIIGKAKLADVSIDCKQCYPRIVLAGYSWGAAYMTLVAGWMTRTDPKLMVDLVFSIDPVFESGKYQLGVSDSIGTIDTVDLSGTKSFNPVNTCKWINFYQTVGTNPRFLGDRLAFAENILISSEDLMNGKYPSLPDGEQGLDHVARAHVHIPYLEQVQDQWRTELRRFVGNSSRDDYTSCDSTCQIERAETSPK